MFFFWRARFVSADEVPLKWSSLAVYKLVALDCTGERPTSGSESWKRNMKAAVGFGLFAFSAPPMVPLHGVSTAV
jgi:hypothetical protein